jgi:hypothetical protein
MGPLHSDAEVVASEGIMHLSSEFLKVVEFYEKNIDKMPEDEFEDKLAEYILSRTAGMLSVVIDFMGDVHQRIDEKVEDIAKDTFSRGKWDMLPSEVVEKMAADMGITVDDLKRDYALGFIDATGEGITQDDLDNIDADNMDFKTVDFDDIKRMAEGL